VTEIDVDLTRLAHQSMTFAAQLGLEILSGTPSAVVGRAAWRPDRLTAGGALHGGYLMAIADSMGGMCAFLNLPSGAGTSTIESKTNFMRGVTEGDVTITSVPVHVGRTTIVVQTDIVRADGKLVSRTIQTQAVLGSG
jgi:uncharacterized protein (TIGR00369 family)